MRRTLDGRRPETRITLSPVAGRLPLTTLLAQALVAFTIEFDNEFEQRLPHRTSRGSSGRGPWLVSLVMWSNYMRFVDRDGLTVRELERLARTGTNLDGMRRWGYITIEPGPAAGRSRQPRPDALIRATRAGLGAREIWLPLFGVIEDRWRSRFGDNEIDRLRDSLRAVDSRLDPGLPDCLPILGYGLFSVGPEDAGSPTARREGDSGSRLPLPALLARVLLAFATEFERESDLSLAIVANLLRVLDEKGVRVADLPVLTGVSKEAIHMAMGILQKKGTAVVGADPSGGRAKVARLTPKGRWAQDAYRQRLGMLEGDWTARFGEDTVRTLRESLEPFVGEGSAPTSPLFRGLEPYPDGWRASVRKPQTLPHYPMVLHRGGFPDGS